MEKPARLSALTFGFWLVTCAPSRAPESPSQGQTNGSQQAAETSQPLTAETAATSTEALASIKIATWNLEWLNRANGVGNVPRQHADYARLKGYADRLAGDIIAVQEVDGEEALKRVFDDTTYDFHVASQSANQLAGFAYLEGLQVTKNPDLVSLNTSTGLRNGVDLTVTVNGQPLRLVSVHLKSGCFDHPLTSANSDCVKLKPQLPKLEEWIDARAAAGEAFIVLGDFNRRIKTGEPFYTEIDDASPPNADLTLVTDGRTSTCWGGEFPQYIDHIVLSKDAAPWTLNNSFAQLVYDAADAGFKDKLSDHCPISIALTPTGGGGEPPPDPDPGTEPTQGPVKGNINSSGRKLYHVPGCPSYGQTQIDESKGERFFATEAEAVAAGWQKASGCP